MIYRTIQGSTVPAIGLGTYKLEGVECYDAVRDALMIGYRHIDTAQMYDNEEQVGRAVADSDVDADELFITTKIAPDDFNRVGEAIDESRRRLQTDQVDLVLLHWPGSDVPLEKALDDLRAAQNDGKVRFTGVSNFTPTLVEQARRHIRLFCNQVEYHVYLSQDQLRDQALKRDYLLTAYAPLAQGKVVEDPTLLKIGQKKGKTATQVALRYLIQQMQVAVIPKSSDAARRRENFDLFDFQLHEPDLSEIAALNRDERLVDPAMAPAWER